MGDRAEEAQVGGRAVVVAQGETPGVMVQETIPGRRAHPEDREGTPEVRPRGHRAEEALADHRHHPRDQETLIHQEEVGVTTPSGEDHCRMTRD